MWPASGASIRFVTMVKQTRSRLESVRIVA
jgi:hypothetical protein